MYALLAAERARSVEMRTIVLSESLRPRCSTLSMRSSPSLSLTDEDDSLTVESKWELLARSFCAARFTFSVPPLASKYGSRPIDKSAVPDILRRTIFED